MIAIFGILTAIVTTNYSRFSNDVVLTNMAYELALSVREAQTYGVAVSNRVDFDKNFGINFSLVGSPKQTQVYTLFEDISANYAYDFGSVCNKGTPADDECYKQYTLQRNIQIVDLEVGSSCTDVNDLAIIFDRPSPEPKINGNESVAVITLKSPEGIHRYVIIREYGQIYVDSDKTDICP